MGVLAVPANVMKGGSQLQLVRTGLWQWLKGTGLERVEMLRSAEGWLFRGTIVALAESGAVEVRYSLTCDSAWRTKRVDAALQDATSERVLSLVVDHGHWYEHGHEKEAVRGCTDVDLGWSPSTNTLPIRRLKLPVGKNSGPLIAAWVRFPELTVEALPQEYERLGERRYRYTSRGGSFVAKLEVDAEGLVLDYEGVWRWVRPPLRESV